MPESRTLPQLNLPSDLSSSVSSSSTLDSNAIPMEVDNSCTQTRHILPHIVDSPMNLSITSHLLSSNSSHPPSSTNSLSGLNYLMSTWRQEMYKRIAQKNFLHDLSNPAVLSPNARFPPCIRSLEEARLYCATSVTYKLLEFASAGYLFDPKSPVFPQTVRIPPQNVIQFFSSWFRWTNQGSYDEGVRTWVNMGKGNQDGRKQWKNILKMLGEEFERETMLGMINGVKNFKRKRLQ